MIMEQEIWKDIPGWEGQYQASDHGRIKSLERDVWIPSSSRSKTGFYRCQKEKILSPRKAHGYLNITLWKDSKSYHYSVHVLIAMAFLGHKRGELYINHIDGNKHNNHVDNLEIVTCKENVQHALATGLRKYGFDNGSNVLNRKQGKEALQMRKERHSLQQIADHFGVSIQAIQNTIKWTVQESGESCDLNELSKLCKKVKYCNTRRNHYVLYDNKIWALSQLARHLKCSKGALRYRLKIGKGKMKTIDHETKVQLEKSGVYVVIE